MMKEIGGYLEIDEYTRPMLHENAIKLNLARNCLAYLIEKKNILSIAIPKFLCNSISQVCRDRGVEIYYYSVNMDFMPVDLDIKDNMWVYIVNYFGLIDNTSLENIKSEYKNLIVDNVHAYYQKPLKDIDTIYTCRKFFGVPDGAILYTDLEMEITIDQDYSCERMHHILARYEKNATDYYDEYTKKEDMFSGQPILRMSKLTHNMLHAIDYEKVKDRRIKNYEYLHKRLKNFNQINLDKAVICPFAYPLLVDNGASVRRELQKKKIYIPTFWPEVLNNCKEIEREYYMTQNILPIPVDQRYSIEEMEQIVTELEICLE